MVRFRWSEEKAAANIRKHGVGFEEAKTVFGDSLALAVPDLADSVGEERWVVLGYSLRGRLLAVAHVDQGDEIRIVSARRASRSERRIYEGL